MTWHNLFKKRSGPEGSGSGVDVPELGEVFPVNVCLCSLASSTLYLPIHEAFCYQYRLVETGELKSGDDNV